MERATKRYSPACWGPPLWDLLFTLAFHHSPEHDGAVRSEPGCASTQQDDRRLIRVHEHERVAQTADQIAGCCRARPVVGEEVEAFEPHVDTECVGAASALGQTRLVTVDPDPLVPHRRERQHGPTVSAPQIEDA